MVRISYPGPYKARFIPPPKNSDNVDNLIYQYYKNQIRTGHGSPDYFRGSTLQRGHGIGDIISTVAKIGKRLKPIIKGVGRVLKPILKKGGKKLANSALRTTANIGKDILEGKNVKKSAKIRSGQEFERLKRQSINTIQQVLRPPLSKPVKKKPLKGRKRSKAKRNGKFRSDNFGVY